jgi:hypothetical protein
VTRLMMTAFLGSGWGMIRGPLRVMIWFSCPPGLAGKFGPGLGSSVARGLAGHHTGKPTG